jgi:monooxygenase
MTEAIEHFDVLIVGAGISGIGAAYHLQKFCPGKSFQILEGRENIGGTWDLFRYPGIRSDSDMYTLGYSFKPWTNGAAIADGDKILDYLNETIDENGFREKIRFSQKVVRANWDNNSNRWLLEIKTAGSNKVTQLSCGYLFMCSGYYNYEQGYLPDFEGMSDFRGPIIHPQKWDASVDYGGKRVVIIGSGATAVTLVPAMAKTAAHVTMLQRSPTYIVSRPAEDGIANKLRQVLPSKWAYKITRAKNVLMTILMFNLARKKPEGFKKKLLEMVKDELGPEFDIERDFTPSYKPWDQRLCLVPDSDLFDAFKDGSASVVTDHIERFTEKGIKLQSGEELEADIIVPATGLNLQSLGGMTLAVNDSDVELSETTNYKGMSLSNVPNFAWTVGYTNASWTLKADLTASYVCRLLNYMDKHDYLVCTPQLQHDDAGETPLLDFTSGYIQRSIQDLPKQGTKFPWKNHQNYISDLVHLKYERINDGVMRFE